MTRLRYAGTVSVGESRPSTAPVLRLTAYGPGPNLYGERLEMYNRCHCKLGDHDLDGKHDHCLNDAGKGHRLCSDCRRPYGGTRPRRLADGWTEAELRMAWGDR